MTAVNRGVDNSNMIFINGDIDIKIHKLASQWETLYHWLPGYLRKVNQMGFLIDRAADRLELWSRIKMSREVPMLGTTKPLFECIGDDLTADIELLLILDDHPWSQLFGPATNEKVSEAKTFGGVLARKRHGSRIVFAIHESLGVLVIAPHDLIKHRAAFEVKNTFKTRYAGGQQ